MCACVHVCIYVGHVAQYPEYLRAKEAVLSPTEAARFSCQHEVIVRICAEYEQGSPDLGAITELMREMQEFGTPPAELMESVGVSVDEAGRPTMLPSSASPSDALSNCALS